VAEAGVEFDWDDANVRHLRRHRISALEFEQVLVNSPLDLDYQTEGGEDRYKSLGVTDRGRVVVAVWTVRDFRIRAVTAYPASRPMRQLYQQLVKETDDDET
jgi:uncharacterized DUF497 family protein